MSQYEIKHKLRVFISSRCGGKYTIARKALQRLLENTGLVETYVFETDPASSQDTISAYLSFVDVSDLCVFIVDNADGVPPAVLSEERRAKDRSLKLIYIFCDEVSKESTPMQEEIKTCLSQKYQVVHEFADVAGCAFNSIIQDLIIVYRNKDNNDNLPKEDTYNIDSNIEIITDSLYISKSRFPDLNNLYKTLIDGIFPSSPGEKTESDVFEELLSEQLKTVIIKKSFDENIIISLEKEIISKQDPGIKELVAKRIEAQKKYYKADFDTCLELLKEAIGLVASNSSIPLWIANDIAVDMRLVIDLIDEQKNVIINQHNEGQQLIEESKEVLYYPYLDREIVNFNEKIVKTYYTELNMSPYTTRYGGYKECFIDLANAFYIAQMHGSIVQMEKTRDRLISAYLMYCTFFSDHALLLETVRLLVTNRKQKMLESLIRNYRWSFNGINYSDIKYVLDCVNYISNPIHKLESKYLLMSELGYYLDDTTFVKIKNELLDEAVNWAYDNNRVSGVSKYIFNFYDKIRYRLDNDVIVSFAHIIFEQKLGLYYFNCFKLICVIDFKTVSVSLQRKTRTILTDFLVGRETARNDSNYLSAIIQFYKTANVPVLQLKKIALNRLKGYYKGVFELVSCIETSEDALKYIDIYLKEATSRNKKQGINGAYQGYADEPYPIIQNIIRIDELSLDNEMIDRIQSSIFETLAEERQTVFAKISALALLQFLYFNYKSYPWEKIERKILMNENQFSNGYEMTVFRKDSNDILLFAYCLFASSFEKSYAEKAVEQVFFLNKKETYSIIRYLQLIEDYLICTFNEKTNDGLLSALSYFCIEMTQHNESDIRYYATRGLIEFTSFITTKNRALKYLSQIMDTGSQKEKIGILSRVKTISVEDSNYVQQIINKGKADNNYLVRYVADNVERVL